jgi:ribonuclease P protein component
VLAAEQRLRDSGDFRRTIRSGRRAGGAALVVHVLVDEGRGGNSRAGFVVSKAVGNAVVRNRVKRRLRPIVRECLAELPASSTLVVRALPPAAGLDSTELRAELTRCLQRVRRGAAAAPAQTGAPS